jgi:septal ring factor EnvC (AmiA/AmiB activator)
MRKPWTTKLLSVSGIALAAVLFGTGCTPKITDEQLAKLRQLREESGRLEVDIRKKDSEKSALERELAARQNEVRDCNQTKDAIQQKLSNWPNSWPDYSPAPPTPPPAPEPEKPAVKKKGKK